MKFYNLFLDDVRIPLECFNYMHDPIYNTLNWTIVRTHEDFVGCIEQGWDHGFLPAIISFDHDLASEHYHPSMYEGLEQYNNISESFQLPTGNESAKFLVEFCIEHGLELPECKIHSMNPFGRERIKMTLQDFEKYKNI